MFTLLSDAPPKPLFVARRPCELRPLARHPALLVVYLE